MNILYQCSEYPPFRNGGIGTVTKIVAEEMARRGHNVYVIGHYPEMEGHELIEKINGVIVYRYNCGLRHGYFKGQLSHILNRLHLIGYILQKEVNWFEKKIENLIKKHNIDILEMVDFYEFNNHNAHLNFHRFAVPTVLRVHGSASFILQNSGKSHPYAKDNDIAHFARTDYLCSVSKFSENYIKENFSISNFKRVQVIYNPIEKSFLKHNIPSNKNSILFIGRLIQTKGAYTVAAAFGRIVEKYPEWRLRMAGGGNIEALRKTISPLVQKNVDFLGFCNRQKIMEEIDNCSFSCIPSFFENFSMVPLEIMGRTRAVIFTNRTSGNEIINSGVDGYTVDPEDIDEVFEKMKNLIEDKNLCNQFAERGYEKIVSDFCEDEIGKTLENFYAECCGK